MFGKEIAKTIMNDGHKVLIIHCGYLNEGHHELCNTYHWDIVPIKDYESKNLKNYTLIIVDETQRIFPTQLQDIITQVKTNQGNCIFSYDEKQCLRDWEIQNNIPQLIDATTSPQVHKLTGRIRTNHAVASFIQRLFNKKK